jgi:hypothetical protein
LEEFTSDYDVVTADVAGQDSPDIVTQPTPPGLPSDHGTIAFHVRKGQLKVDNHFQIPANMQLPPPRTSQQAVAQQVLRQLMGHDIHEELHINAEGGQASFHLGSPILNMCIQVDVPRQPLPPSEVIDGQLQQAQQIATMQFQSPASMHVTVDGTPSVATQSPIHEIFVVTEDSHPELISIGPFIPHPMGRPNLALKFSNYVGSVGNAFDVRACEVTTHSATQTMMAGNPEVRDFVAGRIAEHQRRLEALLEPKILNTRFNFVPLQIVDLMVPPVGEGCDDDVLAQTAPMATSASQIVVLGFCSFAMGVAATYGAMRKKAVSSADAYHQVSE